MGGLFSKPSKPKPAKTQPRVDEEGAAAARREREKRRKARGRGSTILSGSMGDTSNAPVGTRALTGL